MIPVAYCTLKNKTQTTFYLIFNTFKQVRPDLNHVSVTIGYKDTSHNNTTKCFPVLDSACGEKYKNLDYRVFNDLKLCTDFHQHSSLANCAHQECY